MIDARLRRQTNGLNEGNKVAGVPDYLINGNVEWDLPFIPALTLTGRIVHTGEQPANNANTLALPSWTRFDLGARYVALITGEEKILPPEARWFSCTVEAMPLDRNVEFLAVDEVQLCADPDRGHVFTDRLLHARGMVETMFLGAETIRPLLQRLVPNAHVETRPRLSKLTYAGPAKLARLPPREAEAEAVDDIIQTLLQEL